jgi:hypothetical protein
VRRTRSIPRPLLLAAVVIAAAALGSASPARAGALPWCGSGEPTADVADAVSAFEWHVVYAMPSDGVDRFGGYAPRFAGDFAAISNWWLVQDSTRRPRFDLFDAPGCSSEPYGRIDISLLRLPKPANGYSFSGIVADVKAAGFKNPDKGYLVYYDGTLHAGDEWGLCGQGGTDNQAFAYAVVYLQSCAQSYSDDTRALVAAHEMEHGMGAVQSQAPHLCSSGHVCDSPGDLMKASFGPGDSLSSLVLDVGRDDYYAHKGSWWDARNSGLLYDLDQSLDPAPEIANLTATSIGSAVRVDWAPSVSQPNLSYRLYDEQGNLVNGNVTSTTITATGEPGAILSWTIRAGNAGRFLSKPATLRFKVGYGVVDAAGTLLHDTVPPGNVAGLSARRSGAKVVLRWQAVTDPIGLSGYRITAPHLRPVVVRTPTASLPLAGVRGKTLSVAAVDLAGNVGTAATVRAPR